MSLGAFCGCGWSGGEDTVCGMIAEQFYPDELADVLAQTSELRQAFLVGGCVRDWLLEQAPKDFDVEVFGISYEALERALRRWGRTDWVGRSFGVVKLTLPSGACYDFTIPRRDSKVGPGHQGFTVEFGADITPPEAAARRDYTINALSYDPRTGQVVDFFGGTEDLQRRLLRHTSDAFAEDPLRVLRGMQFAGRFGLSAAPETLALCQKIRAGYRELAVERVREEWFKWAAKSTVPSAGLKFLAASGWLEHFPEIAAMCGVPQDSEWHPEGDVFIHTGHACDALARQAAWQQADEESRIVFMLATLAHDFAKAGTTQQILREGRLRVVSPGHEVAGVPLTESFLERINAPHAIRERVLPLVANHMAHLEGISDRSVRRLARRLTPASVQELCLIMTADALGRPPKAAVPAGIAEIQAKAKELQVQDQAPKPILLGRHLIAQGRRPGPEFGALLAAAFEAQLEGSFTDLPGALAWLGRTERADP